MPRTTRTERVAAGRPRGLAGDGARSAAASAGSAALGVARVRIIMCRSASDFFLGAEVHRVASGYATHLL